MTPKDEATPSVHWILLLRDGNESALNDAAAMAAAAVSLGIDVILVWFGAALETLVSGRIEELGEEEAGAGRLLRDARETGRLRSFACSASAVQAGADAVRARVDEVIGWPSVVSLIRSAERAFVW
jgi:predicted peroxiredoxin